MSVRSSVISVGAVLWLSACPSSAPSGDAGSSSNDAGSGSKDGGVSASDSGVVVAVGDAGVTADAGQTHAVDAGGSSGSGFDGGVWSLTPAQPPLTVTVSVDVDAGVIQDFDTTGGTMSVTAADGTLFELTIPDDALISPQTIVMTPVQVAANPFGTGSVWGVQFLPDGLHFNSALTLVITPPPGQTPPVNQQVPFGWSGPNNEVALADSDPTDSRLTLKLLHFSSYAYATATQGLSASLAGVRNRIGGSAEARIESAIAETLAAERQRQLLGNEEQSLATAAEIRALLEEYVREVVEVRVAAAATSCAAARLAIDTVLSISRQAQLLGIDDLVPQYMNIEPLVDTGNTVCLEEEWKLCRDEHIVQRIIPIYLGMERQSQLLGIDTTGKAWEAKADQYIRACHTYRLDVDSSVVNNSSAWSMHESMLGPVKLSIGSLPLLSAKIMSDAPHGPLVSQSYTITYTDHCTGVANIVQHDATLMVQSLTWELKTDPRQPGKGEIDTFKMLYFPNQYSNSVFGSTHDEIDLCGQPPNPPQTNTGLNYWPTYVVVLGENPDYFSNTEGFYFAKWVVHNGSAVLATKAINEVFNDGDIHLSTTTQLVLNHTPAN